MSKCTSLPSLNWQTGPCDGPDQEPEKLVPAEVPGAVQVDWACAHGWPSHHFGVEPLRYAGLEDRWWAYRATIPEFPEGTHLRLVLEGVDHTATVRLDGRFVAECRGLQVGHDISLAGARVGSLLEVRIHPAPKVADAKGRCRAARTTKPAVSYGWDFHPELIPLGLWRPVRLELRDGPTLAATRWRSRLSDDLRTVRLAVTPPPEAGECSAEMTDSSGALVWSARGVGTLEGTLENPQLWWPQGQGAQELYGLVLRSADGQEWRRSVGFRRVRLEMAPGQWDDPAEFPKSRSRPPVTLVVNGRVIFAKGANVAPFDIFPGAITDERLVETVRLAAEANMNLLRIWGGGPALPDSFYDACDSAGVLVLQEFPLACNAYPDDSAYLRDLELEARGMLDRIAPHPCLAAWSGGNELLNAWSGMTDQSHALRLLNALTFDADPDTPFLPTLPVDGLGHGYYLFRSPQDGRECFQIAADSRTTGLTEFGIPGPPEVGVIAGMMPPEELWPPHPDGSWKMHGGFGAWEVEPTSHFCLSTMEHYWGHIESLEEAVAYGQWLQSTGLQLTFEEARRQRPRCGWALAWCLNEPWPNVANGSLIAYPARPKPALDAVRAALRPTLASASIPKFQWRPGELFSAGISLLHDAPSERPAGTVEAWLASGNWREKIAAWEFPAGDAGTDVPGPVARRVLPAALGDELVLELVCSEPAWSSRYRLATAPALAKQEGPRGLNA